MKLSLFANALNVRLIPVAMAVAIMEGRAYGQISVSTQGQSQITASSTFNNNIGITVDANISSLPYSTPSTASDSASMSTVTPNFSSTSLSLSFNQSTLDNKSSAAGDGTIYFTASTAISYSISGSFTIGGTHTGGDLLGYLSDESTHTTLYSYVLSPSGSGTITAALDSTGGSLTGSLTVGDVYLFEGFDELQFEGAQTLTGTTTLLLTPVPEPSTWAILFAGLGMLGFRSFARKSKASAQT